MLMLHGFLLMQSPPETVVPKESTVLEGMVDTEFKHGFAGDASLQVFIYTFAMLKFLATCDCQFQPVFHSSVRF